MGRLTSAMRRVRASARTRSKSAGATDERQKLADFLDIGAGVARGDASYRMLPRATIAIESCPGSCPPRYLSQRSSLAAFSPAMRPKTTLSALLPAPW